MTDFRRNIEAHLESHARYNGTGNMKAANVKLLEIVRALVDHIETLHAPHDTAPVEQKPASPPPAPLPLPSPSAQPQLEVPDQTVVPTISTERDIAASSSDVLKHPVMAEQAVPVVPPTEVVDNPDANTVSEETGDDPSSVKPVARGRKKTEQ